MGVIVETDVEPGKARGKTASSRFPTIEPVMSAEMLALCAWIAEYYVVPLGVVIRSALPAALASHDGARSRRGARGAWSRSRDDLPSLLERDETLRARAAAARVVRADRVARRAACRSSISPSGYKFSPSVLRTLVKRELVTRRRRGRRARSVRLARDAAAGDAARAVAGAARRDRRRSTAAKAGDVFLLHGVTGSGKTLVYIELLRRVVLERREDGDRARARDRAHAADRRPLSRRVRRRRSPCCTARSSDGERYDEWLALREGRKRIAVGARSAIFAPLANLGAIVVDEEHESSYKQGETPRYHAREVAIVRARAEGAVVVLGSATPSLESWANAQRGKYTLLTLPERVGGGAAARRRRRRSPRSGARGRVRRRRAATRPIGCAS